MTLRITQNGRSYDATAWTVRAPAVGEWTADVTIAPADDIVPGACAIEHDAGDPWVGTIRAVRQGASTCLEIHAGADGLNRPTIARHWSGFTDSSEVLRTVAGDASEVVATTAVPLGSWRAKGRHLRDEIAALARWVSSDGWRYTLAGELELGAPSWAVADAPGDIVRADTSYRSYDCEGLPTLAGRTVDGSRVGYAVYSYQGTGLPCVDLRDERTIAPVAPPLDGGTLEAQADGRATIRLDSGLVMGDVPLWHIPGVRAIVPAGCRVIVADLGGDPRAPVAFAAPFDGEADEITMRAADAVTVIAPSITLDGDVDAGDALSPVLRYGDVFLLVDAPPPIGLPPPGPAFLAGFLPTTPVMLMPFPTTFAVPGPPGLGKSRVKA